MATFAFGTMSIDQVTTFIFGSWVCVANGSGSFDSHRNDPSEPRTILTKSGNFVDESNNPGEMLLPDVAKEIEVELDFNSGSALSQIDLSSSYSRTQIDHSPSFSQARTLFGLRKSSAYQEMIKSIYSTYVASSDYPSYVKSSHATASREAPIFDVYSDSDEDVLMYTQIQMSHPQITIWI
jgi:hypothetical protein